jgi:hypothetical protein
MNTTNVFVELLVIGLGPLTTLILLVLIALDPGTMTLTDVMATGSSLALIVPMLAATYILGIIVDRIADQLFGSFGSKRIRHEYFEDDDEYHEARRTIIYHSELMYRLRQYGRSRMRICRGWAVNSLILLIPANMFAVRFGADVGVLAVLNGALFATLLGTLFSWRALAHGEYRKVKGGAEFIRQELAASNRASLRLHD